MGSQLSPDLYVPNIPPPTPLPTGAKAQHGQAGSKGGEKEIAPELFDSL